MNNNYKSLIKNELDSFDDKKDMRLLIKIFVIVRRFKQWR